jgi:hypothetical protein
MRNLLIVLIFIIAGGIIAFIIFYSSQEDQTSQPSRSEQAEVEEEIETDNNCPEGILCIGGVSVPTLPTVKLGASEVYAQENEDTSEDTDEESSDEVEDTEAVSRNTPQNVLVANKDYLVWSVVWVTNEKSTGFIKYGTSSDNLDRTAYDSRDGSEDNLTERFTHYVSITNTEEDISISGLTYHFIIFSGSENFDNEGSPYIYENVGLTSSPSVPASVSITSNLVSGQPNTDYVVVAKQINSNKNESTDVSGYYNDKGGIDLVIGSARTQDTNSYFSYSASNSLDVKLFGPDGYTGFVDSVKLSDLEDHVLNIEIADTGYGGTMYASSAGSKYTLETQAAATTTATTTTAAATTTTEQQLPSTGVEGSWLFTSVFGLVILLLGLLSSILVVHWISCYYYKNIWEKDVLSSFSDEEDVQ